MKFYKELTLKDGRKCILRNGEYKDGADFLQLHKVCHVETDYLLSYPEENLYTAKDESEYLQELTDSAYSIELLAEVDGKLVGTCGINIIKDCYKVRHRAEYGINVLKEYWGLGIGRQLSEAVIELAKQAGYEQLELEVVANNDRAIKLYESLGFIEFGRNPKGFKSKYTGYQELVQMRLEL